MLANSFSDARARAFVRLSYRALSSLVPLPCHQP
jgi:hypothetical protein